MILSFLHNMWEIMITDPIGEDKMILLENENDPTGEWE